ncbi:PDZ domain-containing protein [uncultured Nitrospira sp.]|uniref:PDZ domain-containing protein n=1 Tax=uncultured Nitrospira sp. TaxID=157176 RepID=UPI00313FF98E
MRFIGGMQISLSFLCLWLGLFVLQSGTFGQLPSENMTKEKAVILAEQFGIDVGEVDEEIKEILGLTKAEGVVVYAVIGASPAELSGIKVKAIIKEVDKYEIKTLVDLGTALEQTLPTKNFTVATYEPADPENQGVTGGLNFHFVRILQD